MNDGPPWTTAIVNKVTTAISHGSGLLGKSALVVGPAVVLALSVAFSMHSDTLKLITVVIALLAVFLWYFPFLSFCEKHPQNALLEGQSWAEYQKYMLIPASKEQPLGPPPSDMSLRVRASGVPVPGTASNAKNEEQIS